MLGTLFRTVRHLKPVQIYTRRPRRRTYSLQHYRLHYLDAPDAASIRRWIAENPAGEGAGWEPYPLSRRIVNLIKWARNGGSLDATALQSLALQAGHLYRSIEYHLLANHLFANATALVFAGSFLKDARAPRWLAKGLSILAREIPEQILADGGHFERSPMYHCIILEDLLDLIDLTRTDAWRETASRMLGWLDAMCHPDGRISFFNDSTFGVAREPAWLRAYALRLGIEPAPPRLGESGYIRLETRDTVAIFDVAPLGPDYQPGHAHADTLSFELSHRGRRQIVNSGISTYEIGPERARQRGTAAHNTVRVDDKDQSEMWASFRVGRRARVFDVLTDHRRFAQAAHDGYAPIIHRRKLELADGGLRVTDDLNCTGNHKVAIFFHLAPEVSADIVLDPKLGRSIEATTYHSGFDLSVPNTTVVGRWSGRGSCSFLTEIRL